MPNTREKLIELIRMPVTIFPDAVVSPHITFTLPYAEYLADHLIANGVTVQGDKDINVPSKWIPVTERLPDKGGSYLVFSSKSKTVFTAHYWLGDRWSNRANGQFITHWMPLPEAPKE